jgi:hypothetical protein
LGEIVDLSSKYKKLNQCKEVISQYLTASRRPLSQLTDLGRREALLAITDFLAQQTDNLGV